MASTRMVSSRTHSFAPRRFISGPNLMPVVAFVWILIFGALAMRGLEGGRLPLTLAPVEVKATTAVLPPDQVVLRVRGTSMAINGTPVTRDQLEDRLKVTLTGQGQGLIFVDADPQATYQDAIALLELVQRAGARAVSLTPDLSQPGVSSPLPSANVPGEQGSTLSAPDPSSAPAGSAVAPSPNPSPDISGKEASP